MICNKIKYSRPFVIGKYKVIVELFSRPVEYNYLERSYRRHLCNVIFAGSDFLFTAGNMRSAVKVLINNYNKDTNEVSMFGVTTSLEKVVIERNYRYYSVEQISRI